MNLGITIPFPEPLHEHGQIVQDLDRYGFSSIWSAETSRVDAFSPLLLASSHSTARLGTAVASVFARSPVLLAMSSAALAEAAPGRAVVGIGASSASMVEGWHDRAYARPLQRVVDATRFLRAALSGERVSMELPTFSVKAFTLERPVEQPPTLLIAALREKMLAAAGAESDGVALNWLGARDVPNVLRHVLEARPPGSPAPEVATRIFVCPTDDPAAARKAAKRIISTYLTVPVYESYQRWLGRDAELAQMWDRWKQGDRKAATDAVPDAVVDELIGIGTAAECAAHVRSYVDAGVTSPILKVLPLAADVDPFGAACAIGIAAGRPS